MTAPLTHTQPPLRVIGYVDDGQFVVQCLEYDIAAHGDTPAAAKAAFVEAVLRHILAAIEFNEPLFEAVPKAPDEFWQMWADSKATGKQGERITIPRFTLRRRDQQTSGAAQIPDVTAELIAA